MQDDSASELRSWLKAIGNITGAVNAAQDLKSLLDLVAFTAQELLDLSFCAIMLPDDDEEYLTVAGASGIPQHYISRVNRDHPIRLEENPLDAAPATRAFRSGKPAMVRDTAMEPRASWTDLAGEEGYRSILAVPLLTNAGVAGTLNSYRTSAHDFGAAEIEQLELLAEHAAIALSSARILDDLRDKHRFIARSEEIHHRLLSVSLRPDGIAGVASALHDLLHCEVVIQDGHGTMLAAEPHESAARRLSDALAQSSDDPSAAHELVREIGPHIAADVILDGASVATVWLLDRAGKLEPLDIRAAEHASVVLSLELLRQRTAAEVEQNLRGELLSELLAGADPASTQIRDRVKLMGHDLGQTHHMIVAAAKSGSRGVAREGAVLGDAEGAQRAAAEAIRLTSHLRPRPLIAAVRGVVVALWPQRCEIQAGEQLLRRALASNTAGSTATITVATMDRNEIPAAYRSARGALAFSATDGDSRTALTLDDLGAAGLLLQFAEPEELRRYAERTIGVLRRYDNDHGAELFNTLRAYLSSDLDRGATAKVLILHPNTVSQRLRRIEGLTGFDLHSPRSVVEARTALMLTDVADAVSGVAG